MDRDYIYEQALRHRALPGTLTSLTILLGRAGKAVLEQDLRLLTDTLVATVGVCFTLADTRGMGEIEGDVDDERARQDRTWGRSPHDWPAPAAVKLAVLAEEVGELAEDLTAGRHDPARAELIQVAAVAVAWLESTADVSAAAPRPA